MRRVYGNAVMQCTEHQPLRLVGACEALESPEYQRVMAYHHRAVTPLGFGKYILGDIEAQQHRRHLRLGVAYLQPGIVVALLQLQRREGLYGRAYFSDFGHSSSWSSSSCAGSIGLGLSFITSRPELFFGKAITSRIESRPASIDTNLSKPSARPP